MPLRFRDVVACHLPANFLCEVRITQVEVHEEHRTLIARGTVELPRLEIQATGPATSLVHAGQQVVRGQPILSLDTTDLKREHETLLADLEMAEAEEGLAREKSLFAGQRTADDTNVEVTPTDTVARPNDELPPLRLEVPSEDGLPLRFANSTGQPTSESGLTTSDEARWIVPLVPNRSRTQLIRERLKEIQAHLVNSQLTSPADGIIASIREDKGLLAVEILTQEPELILTIPIAEANNVEMGVPFTFTFSDQMGDAFAYAIVPDDGNPNQVRVFARVQGVNRLALSGLSAVATLPLRTQRIVQLPATAVAFEDRSPYVLLVVNGVVRAVNVNVSQNQGGVVTLVDSLENGDQIVVNARSTTPGQSISQKL
ncbi:MAG: hypothetical protein JNM27_16800 [Leptospirales bacterium]|nr:hypothetical protein [Leptospirales bacterium]